MIVAGLRPAKSQSVWEPTAPVSGPTAPVWGPTTHQKGGMNKQTDKQIDRQTLGKYILVWFEGGGPYKLDSKKMCICWVLWMIVYGYELDK